MPAKVAMISAGWSALPAALQAADARIRVDSKSRDSRDAFRRRLCADASLIERSFVHLYDTAGMRRTHLCGHTNILKRLLIHAGGFNLGLVMRHLIGRGTPRGLQDHPATGIAALLVLLGAPRRWLAAISAWRPLIAAVRSPSRWRPCARTVSCSAPGPLSPTSHITNYRVYDDRVGETTRFTYRSDHEWYWFPQQKPTEVSMLKCYDSVTDGSVSRWSFHPACIDPTAPDDAPCRSHNIHGDASNSRLSSYSSST